MTKYNSPQYKKKKIFLFQKHPDRLLSVSKKYKSAQAKINAIIKEAKKKNYTIVPADFVDRRMIYYGYKGIMRGLVIYKEVDGVEIAYNPIWKDELKIKIKI